MRRILLVIISFFSISALANTNLNGLSAYKYLNKEFYLAALYTAETMSDAALLLEDKRPMKMVMKVTVKRWKPKTFKRMWVNDLSNNNNLVENSDLAETLFNFTAMPKENLTVGDEIVVSFDPNSGMIITLNGAEVYRHGGKEVFNALLRAWVGNTPPSRQFQSEILGEKAAEQEVVDRFNDLSIQDDRAGLVASWSDKIRAAQGSVSAADEEAQRQQEQAAEEARKKAEEEARQKAELARQKAEEAKRQAEELKKAEEKRIAEAKRQEEERRKAEAKRIAEAKRLEDEKRKAEAKRLAEAKNKAEAQRIAAEQKKREEDARRKEEERKKALALEEQKRKESEAKAQAEREARERKIIAEAKAAEEAAAAAAAAAAVAAAAEAEAKSVAALLPTIEPVESDLSDSEKEEQWQAYLEQVVAEITAEIEYPRWSKSRRHRGDVEAEVTINSEGEVKKIELTQETRYSMLNESIEKAVEKVGEFESFPAWVTDKTTTVTVKHKFKPGR